LGQLPDYEVGHNPAFYFPLFKRPIHVNKLTVAELVMIYHSSSEWLFEQNLIQMASCVPFVAHIRD